MIKPLLRTLPSLSGNVKISCNLSDIRKAEDGTKDVWEASVRGARILPIASQLWETGLEAGLLSSSWEFDLAKFYAIYPDVFFKSCFEFNKKDMLKVDETLAQCVRADDFEYGVKRVSYQKNGRQFSFYAPLYIDNPDDIPAYFEIEATVYTRNKRGEVVYGTKKYLRVNIGNELEYKRGYLGRYIKRYVEKIDDNVAFCMPLTNQATYYGIDLKHGGFVTSVDNMMDRIYHYQNTIQNFDAVISGAFERNVIAMKQVLPLSFLFNIQDFLTEAETIRYRNGVVKLSGAYYTMSGKKLPTYDFSIDYTQFSQDVLKMNPVTGVMQWGRGEVKNIMDVGFPSLNDCRYVNYEFSNKLAPWFCRWKMKYTSDEHPYVINNSWAFSKNQDSSYKYGMFPSTFNWLNALAKYDIVDGAYQYNMMLPLGEESVPSSGMYLYAFALGEHVDDHREYGPYYGVISKYAQIQNGYCSNWFSVVKNYSDNIYKDADIWKDTKDDCVYYDGILYDLRVIYDKVPEAKHIDKFAVIIEPDMHMLTTDEMWQLSFADMTLYRQGVNPISSPNAVANDSILAFARLDSNQNRIWENDSFNTGSKLNTDEIRHNEIFQKSEDNSGDYIDLMHATYFASHLDGSYTYSRYLLDYHSLDRYYNGIDGEKISEITEDELVKAIIRCDSEMAYYINAFVLPVYGEPGTIQPDFSMLRTSYMWLPVTRSEAISYAYVPSWAFNGSYSYTREDYLWALQHNASVVEVNSYWNEELPASERRESTSSTPTRSLRTMSSSKRSKNSISRATDDSGTVITDFFPVSLDTTDETLSFTLSPDGYDEDTELYTDLVTVVIPKKEDNVENAINMLTAMWKDGYELFDELPSGFVIAYIIEQLLNGGSIYDVLPPNWQSYSHEDLLRYLLQTLGLMPETMTIYDLLWPKQSYTGPDDYAYIISSSLDNKMWVRHSSDKLTDIIKSYVTHNYNDGDISYDYAYLTVFDETLRNKDYGSQMYYRGELLPSSYFPYVSDDFNSYAVLNDFVREMEESGYTGWNVDDLTNKTLINDWQLMKGTHTAAYWAGCLATWKHGLSYNIVTKIHEQPEITEWEFTPAMSHNQVVMATDIYSERSKMAGHFYGDMIPESKVQYDNDVLWVDPYNLDAVYSYLGYPAHDDGHGNVTYMPVGTVYKDMYVKFLNKTHLFYWYIELFKDAAKKCPDGDADYNDFMRNEWYKYLYVALDKWVYSLAPSGRLMSAPLRKKVYISLSKLLEFPEYYNLNGEAADEYRSFSAFYNHLIYNNVEDVFTVPSFVDYSHGDIECRRFVERHTDVVNDGETTYVEQLDYPVKFELCFLKKMCRADENIWAASNMESTADIYRDIYFYRLMSAVEHDQKYDGVMPVKNVGNMSYFDDMLTKTSSYTALVNDGESWYEEQQQYNEPKVLAKNSVSYVLNDDSMLMPLFDSIFAQPQQEASIFTHYSLHDITFSYVVSDMPNAYTGDYEYKHTNYRYNKSDKLMMLSISDGEKDSFAFSSTYKKYDECYPEIVIASDDLGLGSSNLSTYVAEDGTTYGFYYIKSHINNTSNAFDVTGIVDMDESVGNLRYISYINGHSLADKPEYVDTIFKELMPFIKQQPISVMADIKTIVYPRTYPFDMIYSQVPASAQEGVTETDIIKNTGKLKTTSLLRYYHAMTPLIVPTNTIQNEWRLKMKDVDANLLNTGKYISIGDAPIYSTKASINEFVPYNVYTPSNDPTVPDYSNKSWEYTPLEYKFYNASQCLLLEPHIEMPIKGKMTYDKLLQNETDEAVFKVFKSYVEKSKKGLADKDIVFLLNKYKVSFDSVPTGLTLSQKEKLYTLTIVFDLL